MRGGQAGEGAGGGAFKPAPSQQFLPDPPEADDEAAELPAARVTAAIRSGCAKRGPVTFGNNGIGPIPIPSRAYRKGRL